MRFKIKIIEISDDLKSKSLNIRWFKIKIKSWFWFQNHDFDFKIKIMPISDCNTYGRTLAFISIVYEMMIIIIIYKYLLVQHVLS